MNTKSVRRLDGQGRVILPAHIRKALDLSPESTVTIEIEDDGSIRIRPAEERCCICGENVAGHQRIHIQNKTGDKYICAVCKSAMRFLEVGE